jgi:integrase
MPSYQDKTTKKWFCKFYYQDADGKRRQKLKRGFNLKREADAWERQFLTELRAEHEALTLNWPEFVDLFDKDTAPTLAEHSQQTRGYILRNHVRGAFRQPIGEITPNTIQAWTNTLTDNISLTHAKNIYTQMRAVFNHAMRLYGLNPNPCHRVRPPTKREPPEEMQFWTYDEFSQVISNIEDTKSRTAIILLYWSGIRKGELLALLWSDLQGDTLSISKSMQRLGGRSVITPPKTAGSVRDIMMPSQALEALLAWREVTPQNADHDHIFDWEKRFIEQGIKDGCEMAGVKRIRVHDLRHSHASYLISRGANIKLIAKRLGHTKTSVTLDTYSHLFPSDEHEMISIMEAEE